MEIVYRPLADMKPNPKNPRKAVEGGIEALAESIAQNPEFFEARPILLSDRTGELVIIGGERRCEAARYLGMEKAPSILFHGITEEQEDFILLNDNTHSGKWDEDLLRQWPNELLAKWNAPKWETHNFPPKPNGISERESGSRAAGTDDVDTGAFTYAIRVEFPNSEEQFALLEEMQQRGYSACVI